MLQKMYTLMYTFELSIQQEILKTSWSPQKYEAAQLFSALIYLHLCI